MILPNWIDMVLMACAVWYLSYCVTRLPGPKNSFEWLRDKSEVFGCIYCLSFWVTLALYWMLYNNISEPVQVLGICGLAHLLAAFTGANYGTDT